MRENSYRVINPLNRQATVSMGRTRTVRFSLGATATRPKDGMIVQLRRECSVNTDGASFLYFFVDPVFFFLFIFLRFFFLSVYLVHCSILH